MKRIKVKLVRSTIGSKPVHRRNIESLGLKKIGQVVELDDTPNIRGMIRRCSHLVEVEEI